MKCIHGIAFDEYCDICFMGYKTDKFRVIDTSALSSNEEPDGCRAFAELAQEFALASLQMNAHRAVCEDGCQLEGQGSCDTGKEWDEKVIQLTGKFWTAAIKYEDNQ